MTAVLGIDLSLTGTGLCRASDGVVTHLARVITTGTKADSLTTRRNRLNRICAEVLKGALSLDLAVIEGPSMASRYGHPHDRSGLWWMVVDQLMSRTIPLAVVPPSCRARYATGKGNAPKEHVLTDVVRRYQDGLSLSPITKNDEADALVLAAMGSRHLGANVETSLPASHLKGMEGVEWPITK